MVRSEARSTVRTPTAVAVRSSTTDIIFAALTGELIVGPLRSAATDTFATAFLGRIPDAAGLPCTTTGKADVAMGCCTAGAFPAAAAIRIDLLLICVAVLVVVYTALLRLSRPIRMNPFRPFLTKTRTVQRLLLLMRITPQMRINPEQPASECCTFARLVRQMQESNLSPTLNSASNANLFTFIF